MKAEPRGRSNNAVHKQGTRTTGKNSMIQIVGNLTYKLDPIIVRNLEACQLQKDTDNCADEFEEPKDDIPELDPSYFPMLCNQVDYYFQMAIRSLRDTIPQLTQNCLVYSLPDCLAKEWHYKKEPLMDDPEIWQQDIKLAQRRKELLIKQEALHKVTQKMSKVKEWTSKAQSMMNQV